MEDILYNIKKVLPKIVLHHLKKPYHYLFALLGSLIYRNPSKEITVIGITGTKGKSTVTELTNAIFEAAGKRTALAGTIRFKIADETEHNKYKMTMPGRFFLQKFLRQAVDAGCEVAIVEMTSQGVLQYRHKFIDLDALIFTNLTPEHIESHGSFANYKEAKLQLAEAVARSRKRPRYLVANIDDEHGQDFLNYDVEQKLPYSLKNLSLHSLQKDSISLVYKDTTIRVPIVGLFNVYNTLAAITIAEAFGIAPSTMQKALQSLPHLRGRVQLFKSSTANKQVTAVVDYAHTPDSLEKLYEAFRDQQKICVLGNTGGGRDTWKRPEMGALAEKYCDHVILTNEDPYDEDPRTIVDEMRAGMSESASVEIIMDRRSAIKKAIELTPSGGYVLISGKGSDPYIMGPHNTKMEWSDAETVQELLAELPVTTEADSTLE